MLSAVWIIMVLGALIFGALNGTLDEVAKASTDSATGAVNLAIGLVGVMAFWIGMMRVLQLSGLLKQLARALKPVMTWLFPDVPADHPAMSMMILNISSNMLGLANAATPFGIKAMMELDKLNKEKGTATNAMVLFLAISTSNVALLPTGMIALRASLGSVTPGAIFLTTLLATSFSTIIGISMAKLFSKLPTFAMPVTSSGPASEAVAAPIEKEIESSAPDTSHAEAAFDVEAGRPATWVAQLIFWAVLLIVVGALGSAIYADAMELGWPKAARQAIERWPLVLLIGGIVLYGWYRQVNVYDAIVEGGKEGFDVALRIIPFLVAILVAVGMLRASGGVDALVMVMRPITDLVGMPAEALPMAILRTLSGSGAYGVSAEIMQTHGPDSFIGMVVSTMQGSTETTFYVMAVYLGAVGVSRVRHTLVACLLADLAGALMAVWACMLLL